MARCAVLVLAVLSVLLFCALAAAELSSSHAGNDTATSPAAHSLAAVGGRAWQRITAAAQWSPRAGGVVEWYKGVTKSGGRSIQGPMMLLYGVGIYDAGDETSRDDVWYSTSHGRAWGLVDTTEARFSPLLSAQTVQDSQGRQFRIQGSDLDRGAFTEVYMSTDGGVSWRLQGQLTSPTGRYLGTAVVDSKDTIYVMMGQLGSELLSDMWRSSNQGRTWTQISVSRTAAPPARSVHGSVVGKFRDGTDVIYIMYGYRQYEEGGIGNVYRNDVWISTSGGSRWTQILPSAPWVQRGDSQVEITKTGVIVISSGVSSASGVDKRQLNDVWASLDGGYSWGVCTDNAEFSDRQFQYTVIDDEGYLYTMGGREEADGGRLVNDVWKSTYSYDDVTAVAERCGLFVPKCGVGLMCMPDDPDFVQGLWGVSCAACPFEASLKPASASSSSGATMTILFVVFLLLFLGVLALLVFTCYRMRSSGVSSPIPLPSSAQRWWSGKEGEGGMTEGLNKSTHSDEPTGQYGHLSIRDQL